MPGENSTGANATEQSLEDVLLAAATLIAATSQLDVDRPSTKVPVPRELLLGLIEKVDAASPGLVGRIREKFAAKNSIEIAPVPQPRTVVDGRKTTVTPPRRPPISYRIMVRPGGSRWSVERRLTAIGMDVYTYWIDLPPTADLTSDVLPAAEAKLAVKSRLVITSPWTVDGQTAIAGANLAEDTPAWAAKPWTVELREAPASYEGARPVWEAVLVLDPAFAPITERFGTHNMNLDRAIRTLTTELGARWQLGDWSRTGDTATCLARRVWPAHIQAGAR